ncbi:Universal stress protein [Rosistilla carotiformis]|uniref:Universal stress protein n=1 Tax=Rosistilla carotiformis TaxID=2528017 RepID=A0A518JWG5_9BACT|nr:universal stress protein [Rosistilla carotiformis]QDV69873.1 Universal stress protein [Rosistilla carotiformis]
MRVLLATDRSISSDAAADFLQQLEFSEPVDLNVLSSVPVTASVGFSGLPPVVQSVMQEEEAALREHLAAVGTKFEARTATSVQNLVVGPPGYEIRTEADQWNADLIVMGAVGKSMMERVVLGSVSDFVATHTASSVLVVRPPKSENKEEPPRHIMVALDGSKDDVQLIDFLKRLKWPANAVLHLVHVIEDMTLYRQDLLEHMDQHWQQERETSEQHAHEIQQLAQVAIPSVETSVVVAAHVGEALIKYADRHHCELVITGDHHRNIINRILLGSVSRYVLRYAHCSVVIAREPRGENPAT